MALNNEEALEAFAFLSDSLRQQDLGWVITQVEEKIALGKLRTQKLQAREAPEHSVEALWVEAAPRSKGVTKAAFFTVAEEFTQQERLDILIDSVVLAIPALRLVGVQAFETLFEFGVTNDIVFEPEANIRDSFSLTKEELEGRAEASHRLVRLLDHLRDGTSYADQPTSSR